jgi:hypothetical protein
MGPAGSEELRTADGLMPYGFSRWLGLRDPRYVRYVSCKLELHNWISFEGFSRAVQFVS